MSRKGENKMTEKLNVGLIVTLSGRWPRELPIRRHKEYTAWARETLTGMNLVMPEQVLTTPEEVNRAISEMRREQVDAVVMVYGAFTGDDIAASIVQKMNVPLILWAPYEPPYEREERLWANALCAMTMNAAALGRLGYPCHTVYGSKEDERAAGKVINLLKAYAVKKAMSRMTLGLFGYRPTNYYVSTFDEAAIRRTFGITMNATELKTVFDDMAALPEEEVKKDMEKVSSEWNISRLPEGHLENHSRLYLALKNRVKADGYDFGIIKCWPEMGAAHTQPCAVLGRLLDDGLSIGCEGDVDAGVTQVMEMLLSENNAPFITDMIDINEDENTMTFWHCGNAAPSLHNPKYHPELCNHPLVGQGSAFWTALKPGYVTIARLHNFHGQYKLVLMRGEALDRDRVTRGCMTQVKMTAPVRRTTERLIEEEIPHHYVLVWDDIYDAMKQTAALLNIPVIEL